MSYKIKRRESREARVFSEIKDRKIKPVMKTDKGYLYEIEGLKGQYEQKSYDRTSKRIIFQKVK